VIEVGSDGLGLARLRPTRFFERALSAAAEIQAEALQHGRGAIVVGDDRSERLLEKR